MSKDSLSDLKAFLIKKALIQYGVGNIEKCPKGTWTVEADNLIYWFNIRSREKCKNHSTKILLVKIPKYKGPEGEILPD
jgi:hypothetical protein